MKKGGCFLSKTKNTEDWSSKPRRGAYALSESISRLAALNFAKRGLGNGKIIRQWHKIWPSPWCDIAIARRIQWPAFEQKNGVLFISLSNPAMGPLFLHEKNKLIEYLNIWFGYKAISDIKISTPHEKKRR